MKKILSIFLIFVIFLGFFFCSVDAKVSQIPNKTTIKSVTLIDGKATITWKKVKNVDGYSVYMSNSKNGKYKRIKNIYGNKVTQFTKKNLDNSKKYYFKVKTFKGKNEEKIRSEGSNVKNAGGIIAECILVSTANNEGRNTNLKVCANRLNGTIVKPNKKFMWSKVVGICTKSQGYRDAVAFSNGNDILMIGGGVCQFSTSLYQCAKKSNMKILERHTHDKPITYIEEGEDATVAQGSKDFIFKNNKNYAIKIETDAYENITMCRFYNIGNFK